MSEFTARFNTVTEIFEEAVSAYADRPLFGVKRGGDWQWMTYAEFGDRVGRVRAGLAALGVGRGGRVAIISGNCPEWAIVAYATYGLGAAVVPMYEEQQLDNWTYIISDSEASVVVTSTPDIAQKLESARSEIPQVEHIIPMEGPEGPTIGEMLEDEATPVPAADIEPDDLAGFVYTSGTTGKPKGVLLTHGNIARNVSAVTDVFPLDPDDRTLSFLPWAHAFGQTVELHLIMSVGISTAFAESIPKLVGNLKEVRPTILVSVPTIFSRIYDAVNKEVEEKGGIAKKLFDAAIATEKARTALSTEGRSSLRLDAQHRVLDRLVLAKIREAFGGRLKYAITGGAGIPREVAEFIDALGLAVYEGYGLSETSPIATANWPGSRKIGTVGKPIPGVRIEIDPTVATNGAAGTGEIIIHGHNVMKGYHNRPEDNAEVFTAEGGFRTGDIGSVDEQGFLRIVGRVKEQYKLANGKYVVPTPIEERIALSRYISQCMIYGDNRPYNVALVVPDEDAVIGWGTAISHELAAAAIPTDEEVRKLIQEEIATMTSGAVKGYERVRRFVVIGEMFTTENGLLTPTLKVRRNVVIERYRSEIEGLYT